MHDDTTVQDLVDEAIQEEPTGTPVPGNNIFEWYIYRKGHEAIPRSHIAGRDMEPDEAIRTSRCTLYQRDGEKFYFSDAAAGVLSKRQASLCELVEEMTLPEAVGELIDAALRCPTGTPLEWSQCIARREQ